MPFSFRVLGTPKPQPRVRAWFNKKTGRAAVFDPGTADGWKSCVAVAAKGVIPAAPLECPIRLTIYFYLARPKSHFGTGKNAAKLKVSAPAWPHEGRGYGDFDNLAKSVADVLTEMGAWKDDGQVCHAIVMKTYAEGEKLPGALVMVEEIR